MHVVDDLLPSRRRLADAHAEGAGVPFRVSAFDEDHDLTLEMHPTLFADEYEHKHYKVGKQGDASSVETVSVEKHCVFKQAAQTAGGKSAVVSFCGGCVHARFDHSITGERMHVRPLASGQHAVFRARDLLEDTSGRCGITHENEERYTENSLRQRSDSGARRLETWQAHGQGHMHADGQASTHEEMIAEMEVHARNLQITTNVEVAFFNDFARSESLGQFVEASTGFIVALMDDLYSELPGSNQVELVLVGMFSFVDGNPWTNAITNGGASIEVGTLLDDFRDWASALAVSEPLTLPINDHSHLLAEEDFFSDDGANDGVIGLAFVGGVCLANNKFGITQSTFNDDNYVSIVATHELFHNLGSQHTIEPCTTVGGCGTGSPRAPSAPCNTGAAEVMDPTASDTVVWSSCTNEYLESVLSDFGTTYDCIKALSNAQIDPPVCGNGLVEAGEECDCLFGDCVSIGNTCCNATSCQLNDGAAFVCDSKDPCCDAGCSITSAGAECRPSNNGICDPDPEVCNGVDSTCPVDVVAAAGTTCGGGLEGRCFLGECAHLSDQCDAASSFPASCTLGGSTCATQECSNNICCGPGTGACTPNGVTGTFPVDGSPCSGSGMCYQGNCVSDLSTLPTPEDLINCTNGFQDADETDVDCGGDLCLACFGGQNCTDDLDCAFPLTCNSTSLVCGGGGVRATFNDVEEEDIIDKILNYIKENPLIAAGVGGGILIALALCCISCFCCGNGKDRVPKYVKQASFRRGGKRQMANPAY